MSTPEFSRPVDIRQSAGRKLLLEASESERAGLAARFGLVRIARLEARIALQRDGRAVDASGRLAAEFVQSCAVSAEDIPVAIDEELSLRFVPSRESPQDEAEVEIDAQECDEIEYSGTSFDLGEAVTQSLALAIDPFAVGADADEARKLAGMTDPEDSGPFVALKGLKLGK